jgi:Ca2+-transporting ATPase
VPLLKQGVFSNRFGAFWLLSMVVLTISITSVTAVFPYIKTTSLPLLIWLEILLIAVASTFWIEVKKLLMKTVGGNANQNVPSIT